MIGERLGRYRVLAVLGSGAMGVVVRAHDPRLGRDVAIKVVHPQELGREREQRARARLIAEARALARLAHPNVVAIYEVGEQAGTLFVAMELVEGVDLDEWLKRAPRSLDAIVQAFVDAALGLAQVHAVGLVHRDVKPSNILVGADGRVRVGDFGIAHACFELPAPIAAAEDVIGELVAPDTTTLTEEGRVVGTPAYMAPEQHLDAEVGPAADQYALCVSLFEALFGQRPFRGDARRLLAIKRAGAVLPKRARRVPAWLVAVVMRGLAPDPRARFASIDALAEALRRGAASRRRRLALGSAVIASVGGTLMMLGDGAGRCDRDAAELAGVWDEQTRAAAHGMFAASTRPWAALAWAAVEPRLDAYAGEWTTMRRELCLSAGDTSATVLDRRLACLESRRRALAATTHLLAAADDDTVDHGVDLLGGLRPIAACGTLDDRDGEVSPPPPALARAVADARTELALVRAFTEAGRYAEAHELGRAVVANASTLDYPPLQGEALAIDGRAALRVGPVADAASELEAALWTAIAEHDDVTAAEAATELTWFAGQYQRSLPDAARWAALARASAARSADARTQVMLDNALGVAQLQAGQHDDAVASFERALAGIGEAPDQISLTANVRHNLAKSWFDRGDLARARALLEPSIAALAGAIGDQHPRVLEMRGTLGQVLGAGGDHARAAALFRAEVEGLRQVMGDDALAVAHARTNLGVVLGRLGHDDEAIAVTEQALASFERAGDLGGASTCLGNIADDLLQQGIHDAAAQRFERALALLERLYPEGHADLVYPLVGLGRVRMAQQRWADALANFERADAVIVDSHATSGHVRGLALEGRAQALEQMGRITEALAVVELLIAITRDARDVGPDELPISLLQQAQLLLAAGRKTEAVTVAEEAMALTTAPELAELHAAAEQTRDAAR
ncbi:MAG: protein kinase [Nannocystaceae bacterium]|nr:protein kinase [Nannocystaceae bacterium]